MILCCCARYCWPVWLGRAQPRQSQLPQPCKLSRARRWHAAAHLREHAQHDCGGADMTWQVTHSCGTKPPSRQDCWNYSSGCTCWRGAGWAAVPWTPSHHAVATTHRWPKVHADVVTAAALVSFSGRAAPRACCPSLSRSHGCSAVLMDARNACGTLARMPNRCGPH